MSSRLNRILNRCWLGCGGALAVVFAFYLGATIGVRRWPYQVLETIVITPNVTP